MRRTLTLLIIASLLAFVAPSKQHKDNKHHGQDQHEHEAHKVEHEEGSGVGSTYLESGVSGSGEGKLVLKLLRARFTFAVRYSKLSSKSIETEEIDQEIRHGLKRVGTHNAVIPHL